MPMTARTGKRGKLRRTRVATGVVRVSVTRNESPSCSRDRSPTGRALNVRGLPAGGVLGPRGRVHVSTVRLGRAAAQ